MLGLSRPPKLVMCISAAEQQVCHGYCMCSSLKLVFCLSHHSSRQCAADEGFVLKRPTENLYLSLSDPPPQGLSVVCIFLFLLLISHLSSHFVPLLSPSCSDLLLSLSQRANSQPGNCLSTGHHTCCC